MFFPWEGQAREDRAGLSGGRKCCRQGHRAGRNMGRFLGGASGGYITPGSAPLASKNRLPAQGFFHRCSSCASKSKANPLERKQEKARSGEPGDLDDPPGAGKALHVLGDVVTSGVL